MAWWSELAATFTRRSVFGYFCHRDDSLGPPSWASLVWGAPRPVGVRHHSAPPRSPSSSRISGRGPTDRHALIRAPSGFTTPMLYAPRRLLVQFTIGGLTWLFLGTSPRTSTCTTPTCVVAHFHYAVMIA